MERLQGKTFVNTKVFLKRLESSPRGKRVASNLSQRNWVIFKDVRPWVSRPNADLNSIGQV